MLSPQWMLVTGIFSSLLVGQNPKILSTAKVWSGRLLQLSVILLGSALDFQHVLKQGLEGVIVTFLSIGLVFLLGFIGMKILKLDATQGTLITMGTAICGGSAIGALAPVLSASSLAIAVSIGIVFLLNALAVFVFPSLGLFLNLSQEQFGMWSALAIHDTSAVVAAGAIYGKEALEVATTVKLTRALWIMPITFLFALKNSQKENKVNVPWFIFGFLIFSLAFTFIGELSPLKEILLKISKTGFALTLFLIGLGFHYKNLKEVGLKPIVFGFGLWVLVAAGALFYVTR